MSVVLPIQLSPLEHVDCIHRLKFVRPQNFVELPTPRFVQEYNYPLHSAAASVQLFECHCFLAPSIRQSHLYTPRLHTAATANCQLTPNEF
jgi:hypothetical protein